MKHNLKITIILISMFLITQLIGIFVVQIYQSGLALPYGMGPPENINQQTSIVSIIFSFVLAIFLFILLTKIKAKTFLRIWFFAVTALAIAITLNAFFFKLNLIYSSLIALLIAIPFAYYKTFKRIFLVHNFTELLIYPGIAAIFIPLLNTLGIIILLFLISIYDMWAVWHSGFMQKMAKYQINNLKFFTGFFVPYVGKKGKKKIEILKKKYKNKKVLEKEFEKSKIKVNLAILGGGDVIFPIITAGVFLKVMGIIPALIITLFSTLALLVLFLLARKERFYPAMPFLSAGMYIAMFLNWIIFK